MHFESFPIGVQTDLISSLSQDSLSPQMPGLFLCGTPFYPILTIFLGLGKRLLAHSICLFTSDSLPSDLSSLIELPATPLLLLSFLARCGFLSVAESWSSSNAALLLNINESTNVRFCALDCSGFLLA